MRWILFFFKSTTQLLKVKLGVREEELGGSMHVYDTSSRKENRDISDDRQRDAWTIPPCHPLLVDTESAECGKPHNLTVSAEDGRGCLGCLTETQPQLVHIKKEPRKFYDNNGLGFLECHHKTRNFLPFYGSISTKVNDK